MGVFYQLGEGVEQSYEKAVYWWQKSAEQGNSMAQYNLGMCYANGDGVEQSNEKAAYWFRKACENGQQEACEMFKNR